MSEDFSVAAVDYRDPDAPARFTGLLAPHRLWRAA